MDTQKLSDHIRNNILQVLEPSDRIGVEPKSSPSELRNHPFLLGHGSVINWDTLWISTPVSIERGFVAPVEPRRDLREKFAEFNVVDGPDL